MIPVFVILICLQLFMMQLVLSIDAGDRKKAVQQSEDVEQNAEAGLDPVQASNGKPADPASPNREEDPAVTVLPPVPREEILRSVPAAGKKVALTFDDGPSSSYTLDYLKVLRENQVPATFFLVGRHAQKNPSLVTMIAGEGHEIANHTFDHPDLRKCDEKAITEQIARTSDLLSQWSQQEIKLMRPPGGNISPGLSKVVAAMNLRIVMWAIDPRDWEKNKTSEEIIESVKKDLQPGAIILLHEGKPQTLKALPVLINELRGDGWDFVTVSGLIGGEDR
jgi:peptidoglycan/xylan/chitin deacetylase (PgdA/CDA1 family)